MGDNVSPAWDSYLATAASDWSLDTRAGNPLNLTVVPGATKPRQCRPQTGHIEVCDAAYGNNGWLGVAQIWVTADLHITKGTAKMNDTYYSLPKYDTPFWRGAVMCQEIGHTFGLDHQDTSGADFHTCMDYATNPDADNTHPNYHDYEEPAIIYSHLDSTTTIAAASGGAGSSVVREHEERQQLDDREAIRRRFQTHHVHRLGTVGSDVAAGPEPRSGPAVLSCC